MSEAQSRTNESSGTSTVLQIVGRLIAAAVVLAVTAFFTPGFTINNIWTLAIATLVLAVMDYLLTRVTGLNASPFFCRICFSCNYIICYSIFCCRVFYFLDGCYYWGVDIWGSRLFHPRKLV